MKKSKCDHESESCGFTKSDCLRTASQAQLPAEHPFLGDIIDLQSASLDAKLTESAKDDTWIAFCESCSILDPNSPTHDELTGFETDTPNAVYSCDLAPNVQEVSTIPGTIDHNHAIKTASKVRESQQAFTIYASTSIAQRKYKGPSSLQAFAQWFHVNLQIPDQDLSEHFRHGLHHSEEMDIPPSLSMPALCLKWADYVDAYFQEIAPLFPVVRRENTIRTATYLSRFGMLGQNPVSDRPAMACVYACIALGARSKGRPEIAQAYIEAACSLTGYLISLPYLESAQALLLIAIEHRGREKNGAAFLAVRQAISILNSMGLHRTPSYGNDHLSVAHQQADRRIWWTAYALEKTIALEDGRPSSTHDCSLDQDVAADVAVLHHPSTWKFFVDLAKIQNQISEGFYDQNAWRDAVNFDTMLEMQSRLNEALAQWSDSLPEPLKPCRGSMRCPSELLAVRTLLSLQFNHALIALHRAALTEGTTLNGAIKEISGKTSPHARGLQEGAFICANSAREILTSYLYLIKCDRSSPLVTLNQPLLAVYVLTIYLLKYPHASSTHQDLDLLQSATYAIEKGYQQIGMPARFSRILTTLRHAAVRGTLAYSGLADICDVQPSQGLRCEGSQPVEESVHTSRSATKITGAILMPEQRLTENPYTTSWSETYTELGTVDDILVGTWLDVPQSTNKEITDLALELYHS